MAITLVSCQPAPPPPPQEAFPESSSLVGLASPIQLEKNTTPILIGDYFLNLDQDFRFEVSEGLTVSPMEEGKITISGTPAEALGQLTVITPAGAHHLLLKRYARIPWQFSFDPGANQYDSVQLVGEINDWTPSRHPLSLEEGVWKGSVDLFPGNYQYKVVVNGKYISDPNNPDTISNGNGGYNSLLQHRGVDPASLPKIRTVGAGENHLEISSNQTDLKWWVYWENYRLDSNFVSTENGKLKISIPQTAQNHERSYLRIWAANQQAASNDLLIPLKKGKPISSTSELVRTDPHQQVLYFMMVDRFHNGNPKNDQPVDDDRVEDRANYFGGDIAGITEKLKAGYFSDLHMNTIWLSPIIQNPEGAYQEYPEPHRYYSGYHGYWPVSFTRIDHRMGTSEELKALVAEAHQQGMNIILDFVSNHVHQEHPFYQRHPDWVTQLDLPDGTKNIRIWEAQRLTTWFDTFLPSLDFSQPQVIETLTDSALFWVDEYNLDGFRHDATKHIPEAYWRTLTRKLKSKVVKGQGRSVFQIGETFGSRELIGSYVGSGQLDGQFDFNLYFDACAAFANDDADFDRLAASLRGTFAFYGYHHLMGNITGNHDMPRFIATAGGDLQPDEDSKEAGWSREIVVKDPLGYERLKMLTAFTMTVPGVPVVYYGDAIGLPGANDPDSRRPMVFENLRPDQQGVKANLNDL
ncbi:MAG: alpha-amylase family glycosyl hydrolase, partial [Salibacteraceae bacterium]